MRKGLVFILGMSVSINVISASQQIIWGNNKNILSQFKQNTPFTKKGLLQTIENHNNDYQLKLIKPTNEKTKHPRYQITYKGLPIFGYQLVFHAQNDKAPKITGINIKDLELDLPNIDSKLSEQDATQLILKDHKNPVKFTQIEKVVFIEANNSARLAYHLSYYESNEKTLVSAPNYLIDAQNGDILKKWNEARREKIGQGLGGNAFNLPFRPGMFQHGDVFPGIPSLGKFDVQISNGSCHVENEGVRVINLENNPLGYEAFPITVFDEKMTNIEAYSYPCPPNSLYLNYSDGKTGPINYSFSPVNDTMYFAQKTIDMYQSIYNVASPLGDDLPVRAYTHLGEMDNAFAIPTIRINGEILAHQQIVIGNGMYFLTAPAQSIIAHELSHNFTELNSGLFYEGQSGGINEAFSDMAAIAIEDYVRQDHPWYWDGEDWGLGREAMIGGQPMRYMDDPTKDGRSIGHASDYNDSLDVHYSSGVFNKAFYLLSHKPGWSVQSAFQVMIDANKNYWSPLAYYDFAACGVIQAAADREWDASLVIEAFNEVGVSCPIFQE